MKGRNLYGIFGRIQKWLSDPILMLIRKVSLRQLRIMMRKSKTGFIVILSLVPEGSGCNRSRYKQDESIYSTSLRHRDCQIISLRTEPRSRAFAIAFDCRHMSVNSLKQQHLYWQQTESRHIFLTAYVLRRNFHLPYVR